MAIFTAITTILSAISGVTKLFNRGKEVVKEIKGDDSPVETEEDLKKALSGMTPEEQAIWVESMYIDIRKFEAATNRIILTEEVSETVLDKIDTKTANKIAIQRRTTRPWAARMAMHYILFPLYLMTVDVIQLYIFTWIGIQDRAFKAFAYVFGNSPADASLLEKALGTFTQEVTLMGKMYNEALPWVVSIVLGFMGLRQIDKKLEKDGKTGIVDTAMKYAGKATSFFKK